MRTIYEAPISFNNEKLDQQVLDYFQLKTKKKVNLNPWKKITKIVLNPKKHVNIAIIGKYVNLKDAYKSLDEALIEHGNEEIICGTGMPVDMYQERPERNYVEPRQFFSIN